MISSFGSLLVILYEVRGARDDMAVWFWRLYELAVVVASSQEYANGVADL